MKSKRFLCLLLVLLMVFSLTPSETRAETTVYFTAVNDQLLPDLSDETMPFWSGGRLYIPSTVITGTDLGLFYSRSRDKSTAVVYRQGSALTFNFAAGTVADQNDRQYGGPAIVRSDVVFLPLDLLTQFFSLDYSYTRVTYGYLVRVKSDTVVLSDAKFIDAAAMSMEQRYNEYMKTHSESNDPGNTPDQNTDGDRDLVCLALRVTDEESANALLDTLASNNATATFLFSEEQLSSLGDLLRRVVISGNAAALRIDASGGSSRTVSAIERANNALWAACNEKARLVALYGASDKTLRAVRAAATETGTQLVLDEIQSGYGRTGRFFAHQAAGIRPDLITTAKGMANGFPIGGVLIAPHFEARPGLLGTTFGGSHLACAAAIAVLEVIERDALVENAAEIGDYLLAELHKIGGLKEVRGRGLMIGIEIDGSGPELRKKLLFDKHIFTGGAGASTVRLLPALCLTKEMADRFLTAFDKVKGER